MDIKDKFTKAVANTLPEAVRQDNNNFRIASILSYDSGTNLATIQFKNNGESAEGVPVLKTSVTINGGDTALVVAVDAFASSKFLIVAIFGPMLAYEKPLPQVRTRAWLQAAQNNLTSGNNTKVLLDTITYDVGENFDLSNNLFTVPYNGYYMIIGSVGFLNGVADKRYGATLFIDSVQMSLTIVSVGSDATVNPVSVSTDILYLNQGQIVELYAFNADGTSTTDLNPMETRTFLDIHLISF